MPTKKKQHQIPKSFMKNFSQKGKLSCIIDQKNKLNLVKDIPYKNQCFENFYYGKDLVWENKLEKIENLVGPIIDNIVSGSKTISKDNINLINDFIAYQIVRVPSFVDKELLNDAIIFFESYKIYLESNNYALKKTTSFENIYEFYLKENKRNVIDKVMFLASEIKNHLIKLNPLVVRYKTRNRLIFSDNPVMLYNDLKIGNQGIGNKGIVVILPVSPNVIICLYDKYAYTPDKFNYLVSDNEIDVSKINSFQIITRNQKVYFDSENDFRKLIYLFDKTKAERQKYIINNKPKVFENSSNKLIEIKKSYFDKKIDISFLKNTNSF